MTNVFDVSVNRNPSQIYFGHKFTCLRNSTTEIGQALVLHLSNQSCSNALKRSSRWNENFEPRNQKGAQSLHELSKRRNIRHECLNQNHQLKTPLSSFITMNTDSSKRVFSIDLNTKIHFLLLLRMHSIRNALQTPSSMILSIFHCLHIQEISIITKSVSKASYLSTSTLM